MENRSIFGAPRSIVPLASPDRTFVMLLILAPASPFAVQHPFAVGEGPGTAADLHVDEPRSATLDANRGVVDEKGLELRPGAIELERGALLHGRDVRVWPRVATAEAEREDPR